MARVASKIFLLVAGVMAVVAASHTAGAQEKQQVVHATEYVVDDSIGGIALYPGTGYRSYVEPRYVVPSLEDLERRVSQLPPGAKLYWKPYRRDPSGKPILFFEGQYDIFAKFCRNHTIELIVSPSQPGNHKPH